MIWIIDRGEIEMLMLIEIITESLWIKMRGAISSNMLASGVLKLDCYFKGVLRREERDKERLGKGEM